MAENQGKLKQVLRAKKQLELLFGEKKGFIDNLVFNIFSFAISLLEELIGRGLYIEAGKLNAISPSISKLTQDAIEAGFLKNIHMPSVLADEPRIFMASAQFGKLLDESDAESSGYRSSSGFGGADFFSKEKALIRCVGESIERTCLAYYKESDLVFGSYRELGNAAVDPREFMAFSKEQMSANKAKCSFDESTIFGWVEGRSLINGKKILVPAQLIYLAYRQRKNEPVIRSMNSTGAAAYTDKSEAIYRGICEAVERDAVMIHYLNNISPPVVDLINSGDDELQAIAKTFKRYNLELSVLDLTTDIDIPVFGAFVIDRYGGPAVTISSKSDFDTKKAIVGALEEAVRIWWGRKRKIAGDPNYDYASVEARILEINVLKERGMLWAQPKMTDHVEFLAKGKIRSFDKKEAPAASAERLDMALNYFRKNNLDVISINISVPAARKIGFYAYMTLIPSLQPLYLDEKYRSWGCKRLYEVPVKMGYYQKAKKENELNKITHPYV